MKATPWITLPALAVLTAAAAVQAQNPAPAPVKSSKSSSGSSKPPVHKPEQSSLNQLQQDARAKKALQESADILRESVRKEQAATKEAQRLNKDQARPDPEKALQDIKDKLSPQDTAALKEQLKKTAKTVLESDEAKKLIEETRKKGAAAAAEEAKKNKTSAPSGPAPAPPPTTFDKIPPPVPASPAVLAAPPKRTITSVVNGDKILLPPTSDLNHPGQPLKPQDPAGRTYVITGNAQIKMPSMQVDADQIICLKEVSDSGPGGLFDTRPAPSRANDPVKPAAGASPENKTDSSGLESMVATGRVRVVRLDKGKEYHGKGNRMVYEQKTGATTITGWPTLQEANRLISAKQENAVIVLYSNGRQPYFDNCSVRMLSDQKTAPAGPATAAASAGTAADSAAAESSSGAGPALSPNPASPGTGRRSAASSR